MSKSTEKVKVTLSHNQEIDGAERKAGEQIEVDARLARALKARGAVQIDAEKRVDAAAEDPDAATVADLRALAEQRGVDLTGVSRKADIRAALDAAPEAPAPAEAPATSAASAEKGGKR